MNDRLREQLWQEYVSRCDRFNKSLKENKELKTLEVAEKLAKEMGASVHLIYRSIHRVKTYNELKKQHPEAEHIELLRMAEQVQYGKRTKRAKRN